MEFSATDLEHFESRLMPIPFAGCWIWTMGVSSNGYGSVTIKPGVDDLSHRAAWRLYRGPIPKGAFVCHHCDNRLCANPDHLFLGNNSLNMRDMHAKGRGANTLLTIEAVREIRRRYIKGRPGSVNKGSGNAEELSLEFGVCRSLIQKVAAGIAWKHII